VVAHLIEKITSGGQSGVDRAALDTALLHGIKIGGWCPKGGKAEDGVINEKYGLSETPSAEYDQRTEWNVRDSDGTIILYRHPMSGGTLFTKTTCVQTHKPCCIVDLSLPIPFSEVVFWLNMNEIHCLNVAGPRESQSPGIYEEASQYLQDLFQILKKRKL
jgi:hypothetical protein